MSEDSSGPQRYRVTYSERTRQRLLALSDIARERGDGDAFVAALKEFHRRLRIYPQFGEPLIDLKLNSGAVWIGVVRPLALRYGLFEEIRTIIVAALQVLLPKMDSQ